MEKKQLDTDWKSLNSISYFNQLSTKAKELFWQIKKIKKWYWSWKTDLCKNWCIFNFNKFKNLLDLASNIYRNKKLLKDAENKQYNMKILLSKLRNYNPTKPKKISQKRNLKCCKKIVK